jgi:hypothetical protein
MSEAISVEKFAGSKVEIDSAGDYLVNTTSATNGDVRFQLAEGRAFVIEMAGEPVLEISKNGGQLRIDIGGGAQERLVLGDALMALHNRFFLQYDTHTHPTAMGPSGPPPPSGASMSDAQLSTVARTK